MKYEEMLLLDLCRCEDHSINSVNYSKIDWENLMIQSINHKVVGTLFRAFAYNSKAPLYFRKIIQNFYFFQKENGYRRIQEFTRVLKLLVSAGIQPVIMKGFYLVPTIYKDPGLREFSDLDILVREDEIPKCKVILKEIGYVQGAYNKAKDRIELFDDQRKGVYERDLQHEAEFVNVTYHSNIANVFYIDLHRRLTTTFDDFGMNISGIFSRLVECSREICLDNNTLLYRMSDEDFLIHMCIHNYWHTLSLQDVFEGRDIYLRSYMDIRKYIQAKNINWLKLREIARVYRAKMPVEYSLYYCHKIFGDVLSEDIIGFFDVEDIIEEGRSIHDRWLTENSSTVLGYYDDEPDDRIFKRNRFAIAMSLCNLKQYYTDKNKSYFQQFI